MFYLFSMFISVQFFTPDDSFDAIDLFIKNIPIAAFIGTYTLN